MHLETDMDMDNLNTACAVLLSMMGIVLFIGIVFVIVDELLDR